MPKKYKMLNYRRAIFPEIVELHDVRTLEDYTRLALTQLPAIEQRRFNISGKRLEALAFELSNDDISIHYSICTPGEEMSAVPNDQGRQQVDMETISAPSRLEYRDGDVMAVIRGNNIVLCANNVYEGSHNLFFRNFFNQAGLNERACVVDLIKIGRASAARRIQQYGVKSIELNSSVFTAALWAGQDETSERCMRRLLGGAASTWRAFFAAEADFEQAEREQALHTSIKFNAKGRFIPEVVNNQLAQISESVFDQEEDGYKITLKNKQTITPRDIAVAKQVRLEPFGKSVFRDDAWHALREFMLDLRNDGTLTQN